MEAVKANSKKNLKKELQQYFGFDSFKGEQEKILGRNAQNIWPDLKCALRSGASVPEELVDALLDWLAERGYGNVETVTAIEESLQFAMPQELRRELKAAGR